MTSLPVKYDAFLLKLIDDLRNVDGHLTEREVRFLSLLAACPTTEGEILEIGSYKGKSTITLSKSSSLSDKKNVIAIDPLTSLSETDPDLEGQTSCEIDFFNNIASAGIQDNIEFHQNYSFEVAKSWDRKLRLLWIDGDHTYDGTKKDFEMFSNFLNDKAVIAFHDVLTLFDGPIKIFMEKILMSDKFGPFGFCGSIGWAQHIKNTSITLKYSKAKKRCYNKLARLVPHIASAKNYKLKGLDKVKYKLARSRIPHHHIKPSDWIDSLEM